MHVAAALDRPLVGHYTARAARISRAAAVRESPVIRLITGYHKVRKGMLLRLSSEPIDLYYSSQEGFCQNWMILLKEAPRHAPCVNRQNLVDGMCCIPCLR